MPEVKGPRIPEALQQVFLASNRGKEIHKPPPGNVAVKVFKRTWFWQKKSSITRTTIDTVSSAAVVNKKGSKSESRRTDKSKKSKGDKDKDKKKKKKRESSSNESPQLFLMAILESRGYSMEEFMTLETAYHNTPTPLQEASYGGHIIDVVRRGGEEELRELMSTGLSPNACNLHGESLIHMACRRGESGCLNVLVEYGATLEIADDNGRTPLHEACWCPEPNFDVVEIIMRQDIRMFNMLDARKQSPLTYVRKDVWKPWKKFLLNKCDAYWPNRNSEVEGPQAPPPLTLCKPNSRPIPPPREWLPLELASMVAQGKMDPAEALFLRHEADDDGATSSVCSDSYTDSEDSDDSYDSDDSDSEFSFDEEEMAMILQNVGGAMPIDWK